uniref:Uncharacterized protein n=2 Tax=Fusarium oxysporum TaxID=5507 RepID=A0A0D2YD08_FUSOF
MADPMGAEIVVEQDAPFSTPKRPSRVVKPTSKVRDTARQLEDTAIETRRNTRQTTRNVPAEEQIDRPTETRKSSGSGSGSSDGRAMLQKALDLLAESRRETKRLQEALKEQIEMSRELKEAIAKQEETVHEMSKQMVEIKEQMTEELQRVREQLETITTNALDGPQRSYADVTRLTPFLPHNDSRTLAAPPNPTDMLYCTIDVSRLGKDETRLSAGTIRATVENEVRSELDNPTWRCRAVTRDPKNPHRIRITCRDESEHEIVKRAAETKLAPGARILRDDLKPGRPLISVGTVQVPTWEGQELIRPPKKARLFEKRIKYKQVIVGILTKETTRNVPAEEQIDRPTETRKSSGSGSGSSDGRAMLQKALDLLAESRRETKRLQEALKEQIEMSRELKEAIAKQEETVHEMSKQMVEIKEQMTEELQRVREQLETITTNALDGPQRSYADEKMRLGSQPGRSERQWRTKSAPNWIIPRGDAER